MSKPKVSVICTVRNGSAFLEATIASILAQSLSNWELIIVDDGSEDDTSQILGRFAREEPRIRPLSPGHVGRSRALNLAIAQSRADYIANIDADDPSHPARLEIMSRLLDQHPEYAVMGSLIMHLFGPDEPAGWPAVRPDPIQVRDVTGLLPYRNPLIHSSVVMRRSALEAVGGYSEDLRRLVDYDLWVRLAQRGYRLGLAAAVLATHRIHARQNFEYHGRIGYLVDSAKVQARAIRGLRPGSLAWVLLVARFGYGLLPHWIRRGRVHGRLCA